MGKAKPIKHKLHPFEPVRTKRSSIKNILDFSDWILDFKPGLIYIRMANFKQMNCLQIGLLGRKTAALDSVDHHTRYRSVFSVMSKDTITCYPILEY